MDMIKDKIKPQRVNNRRKTSKNKKDASSTSNKVNIRLLALRALHEINQEGAYANIVIQRTIKEMPLSDQDRRFFTEIVYGVVRRRNYLDALMQHLMKKSNLKSKWAIDILRMGLYQLIYMDKVPESAAINESVKLTKKLANGLAGFVNAILRNYIREKEKINIDTLSRNKTEKLALTYNLPEWLIEYWMTLYDEDYLHRLCSHFNEQPKLYCRINTLKIGKDELLAILDKDSITYTLHPYLDNVICIDSHRGNLGEQEWFVKGYITFMDPGSIAIGEVVHAEPGNTVLDVCAAPGSKSLHIASMMNNNGIIKACDIYEHKLSLINENAQRLGIRIIQTALQDGTRLAKSDFELYDRVLVDAPCSGLGILRRKLDMRWKKEKESLHELPKLQSKILDSASAAVKVGGFLIYSTCTLNPLENEGVVELFLKKHKNFQLIDASPYISLPIKGPMITVDPILFQCDGFFIALLQKKSKHSGDNLIK